MKEPKKDYEMMQHINVVYIRNSSLLFKQRIDLGDPHSEVKQFLSFDNKKLENLYKENSKEELAIIPAKLIISLNYNDVKKVSFCC